MLLSLLKRGFLAGLLAISFCATARPFILTIDASSNNGTKIGSFIGQQAQKNFPDIAKQYDSYLAFLLSPAQFEQLILLVDSLKAGIDPDYRAEADAIAVAWQLNAIDKLGDGKLSANEFWLLQLLPDLTSVNKGPAFAVANHSDHNPIAARNLDWQHTPDLTRLQTVNIYQYEGRTVVSVGFAGLVGVVNGFNDQGLFVSLLDASEQQISTAATAQHSSAFELRAVLKQMHKIEPAGRALAQKTFSRSLQFLLADQNNVAVLEQPVGTVGALRTPHSTLTNEMPWPHSGQLAVVDCFVLDTSPRNCYSTLDYYRWGRFGQLLKPLPEQGLTVADVIALMLDKANSRQAIFNQNTMQSIVFTPKGRVLYLYAQTAGNPANPQPIFEKYQFIKTDPGTLAKLIDIVLLALGVGVLAATWVFVFRGDKHKD